MKFKLTYEGEPGESVVVDYLGVFEAGKEYAITEEQAEAFQHSRGVPLDQSALPDGVEIVVVSKPIRAEEKEK